MRNQFRKLKIVLLSFALAFNLAAQELPKYEPLKADYPPLRLAEFVAENIIDQTRFGHEYVLQPIYPDIEAIDFGKSLDNAKPAIAYALSTLFSEIEQEEIMEVGRTGSLKIWINDKLVFDQKGDRDLPIVFKERTYDLPESFIVKLNKGENKILVKSEYSGKGDWLFFLQSRNLGRYAIQGQKITASLKNYAPNINIVNWLILGCFENPDGKGIDIPYEPEHHLEFHKVYSSGGENFAWNIPRINIISRQINSGKFYSWIYHVGAFVWGLQRLSQETGNSKYADYADSWCQYSLSTIPLATYQTKELFAVRSMNSTMVERPMLDFTTAPSLPFINRLVYEKDFPSREKYVAYAEKIMNYIMNEQFRLSNGLLAREYTISVSVWADDMFMGIPYILYSAKYTDNPEIRRQLYDDAANQVIQFNKLLFKNDKQLYMQACYVDKPEEKIPFWSRGNGWAMWGTTEALLHLPKNHKQYKNVLHIYRKHVEGIARAQDDGGYWHNILDMPETVREASGTAMFTLCIARGINNGWLDKKTYGPVVEKAWEALLSFIDTEGNLHGVKGGTNFSTDPEHYARTPFRVSDTHGILPLLFACIEMEHFLSGKK